MVVDQVLTPIRILTLARIIIPAGVAEVALQQHLLLHLHLPEDLHLEVEGFNHGIKSKLIKMNKVENLILVNY